jgi:hypothetical protein
MFESTFVAAGIRKRAAVDRGGRPLNLPRLISNVERSPLYPIHPPPAKSDGLCYRRNLTHLHRDFAVFHKVPPSSIRPHVTLPGSNYQPMKSAHRMTMFFAQ